MVKIQHYLPPKCSNLDAIKQHLYDNGILHKENENMYRMAPEAVDPAILSRGSTFRRYTRSALLQLRDNPLSLQRPSCVSHDTKLLSLSIWKLNNNQNVTKKTQSNATEPKTAPVAPAGGNHGKGSRFMAGDLMPAFAKRVSTGGSASENHTHNEVTKEPRNESGPPARPAPAHPTNARHNNAERERQPNNRRIGSGRIAPADAEVNWDMGRFQQDRSFDFSAGREAPVGNGYNNGANVTEQQDSMYTKGNNTHYRNRQYGDRNEEPEWFTGGPTSRLDIIELRGFDENETESEGHSSKTSSSKNSSRSDIKMPKNVPEEGYVVVGSNSSPPPARSTPTKHLGDVSISQEKEENHMFNYDEFLTADPLNSWFGKGRNSKFSHWFNRPGLPDNRQQQQQLQQHQQQQHHQAQLQHHQHQLQQPLKPEGRPILAASQPPPVQTQNLSASMGSMLNNSNPNQALLEFLQRGKFNNPATINPNFQHMEKKPAVIPSVQELEARMRNMPTAPTGWPQQQQQQQQQQHQQHQHPQQPQQHPHHHQQHTQPQQPPHPHPQMLAANNRIAQQQMNQYLRNNHQAINAAAAQQQNMEAFKRLLQQLIPMQNMQNMQNLQNIQTIQQQMQNQNPNPAINRRQQPFHFRN